MAAKAKIVYPTKSDLRRATAFGKRLIESPWALVGARYDFAADAFQFDLRNGVRLTIPKAMIGVPVIVGAEPRKVERIEIDAFRTYVIFPDIEEGVNPVGMMASFFNAYLQGERGKSGGKQTSAAKAAAARKNGAKGGRPRAS